MLEVAKKVALTRPAVRTDADLTGSTPPLGKPTMATIRDVARAAAVSTATVSRVLNGTARVSDETRRRVSEAAKRLDYWPNGSARSLIHSRTQTLGVLLPDIFGEFFSEVIRGIDKAVRDAGLQVLLSSSHSSAEGLLSAAKAMAGRVDGFILMAPDLEAESAVDRIRKRFPLVLLNPRTQTPGTVSVSIANYEGAFAAVSHLIRLGHKRIAIVAGPMGNADSDERLRGYRAALVAHDIEPDERLVLTGAFTEVSGYEAGSRILRLRPAPTAVFAANDGMAIGLISRLSEGGVRVPDDVGVMGFDDIPTARYLAPPLSTVRTDAYELGACAVSGLLDVLGAEGEVLDLRWVMPWDLVIRRSCGALHGPRGSLTTTTPETTSEPAQSRGPILQREEESC